MLYQLVYIGRTDPESRDLLTTSAIFPIQIEVSSHQKFQSYEIVLSTPLGTRVFSPHLNNYPRSRRLGILLTRETRYYSEQNQAKELYNYQQIFPIILSSVRNITLPLKKHSVFSFKIVARSTKYPEFE